MGLGWGEGEDPPLPKKGWEPLTTTTFLQVRFSCAPRKLKFFVGPMNLVDLFAILPFVLDLIIGGLQVRD